MGQLAIPRSRRKILIRAMKALRGQNDNIGSDFDKSRLPNKLPKRVPAGANVIISAIQGTKQNIKRGARSSN